MGFVGLRITLFGAGVFGCNCFVVVFRQEFDVSRFSVHTFKLFFRCISFVCAPSCLFEEVWAQSVKVDFWFIFLYALYKSIFHYMNFFTFSKLIVALGWNKHSRCQDGGLLAMFCSSLSHAVELSVQRDTPR